ncbi:MAG TPA: glycosyltransferase family 2 protein [Polyangia bacterium]|jgi:glycosyltransferase involved in cell wall biosynthesis
MKASVIIPVYNEAGTVAQVVEKVRAVPIEKEIIVVNDGSSDGTREALARYEGDPDVRVHNSPINLGKGGAVRIGFTMVRGDIVIIQDADLELDPGEYPRLIAPILDDEADVVFGSRFTAGRGGDFVSYFGNRGLTAITNLLFGGHLTDMETCYKIFRASILPQLKLKALRFELEPEMAASFLLGGWRIVEVPVSYAPRTASEGKKIRWSDGLGALATLLRKRFRG